MNHAVTEGAEFFRVINPVNRLAATPTACASVDSTEILLPQFIRQFAGAVDTAQGFLDGTSVDADGAGDGV